MQDISGVTLKKAMSRKSNIGGEPESRTSIGV